MTGAALLGGLSAGLAMAAVGGAQAAGSVGGVSSGPVARGHRRSHPSRILRTLSSWSNRGRRASRAHRRAIDEQVPQLLDLLAAASSAGLSAELALRRSVDVLGGPLAAELAGVVGAMVLGGHWRVELGAVAERLGLPALKRTCAVLARTDTLGTSLAEATRDLAASVRSARRTAMTERARTAPVKMLFPLVLLVLPAFLLLTVVPVLLTTLRSIG